MNHSPRIDRTTTWRRGLAAIEFALVAPFILLMTLAAADLSIFLRTAMRIDETATELALVVTQYENLYTSDFTGLFSAAQTIAGTTSVTGLFGATIITGIVNTSGKQTIAWQQRSPSATFSSVFGKNVGATPVLPNNYTLPTGGVLIAVEVFTSATPWVFSARLMGASNVSSLRSYALYQPRLGSLATVTSGNRPP
jgi:Flp pilus assembly protein TadG